MFKNETILKKKTIFIIASLLERDKLLNLIEDVHNLCVEK